MRLVAGVDSSTQSCKVVIREAETGALVRQGRAAHPDGTEVDPRAWWEALRAALSAAGGLGDVAALSVAGQQHGMVCLDEAGQVVRPALLWNDTRSAAAADELVRELPGGPQAWADAVGSVPVASFTISKLRWLARHEPHHAAATATVCLPHDWLTWLLAGGTGMPTTDRSDASGTGYWSAATGEYRTDLLRLGFGRGDVRLPQVLGPATPAGVLAGAVLAADPMAPGPRSAGTPAGAASGARGGTPAGSTASPSVPAGEVSPGQAGELILGPGAGDNAAAALGVAARPGDVVVSIGTSGTVFSVAEAPAADGSGAVAGFADATGRYLPLVCTLNAARVLDAAAGMLGVDHDRLSELALAAPPGAGGLTLVPYLEGERTPNRPHASGALHGLTLRTATPECLARAAVEGMLCALADGLDALLAQGATARRVILIGGGAGAEAVRRIAPQVFGCPVLVPPPGEYVADGAARQAAWVLHGGAQPPDWTADAPAGFEADPVPEIRERYAIARAHVPDLPA